jgi:hypothetical protein
MSPKNPHAVALGRKGGQVKNASMTPEERSESARKAAEARWAKTEKLVAEITVETKKLLKQAQKKARQLEKKAGK